jgi:hypothetical protein
MYREQWGRQESVEALTSGKRGGRRAPDVDLAVWAVQRIEEPKPLDVVHVEVGEKDVHTRAMTTERGP